jgi:hypothetical protein
VLEALRNMNALLRGSVLSSMVLGSTGTKGRSEPSSVPEKMAGWTDDLP